jgi:hypothetical protein
MKNTTNNWRDPNTAPPGIPLLVHGANRLDISTARRAFDGWLNTDGKLVVVSGWLPLPLPVAAVNGENAEDAAA